MASPGAFPPVQPQGGPPNPVGQAINSQPAPMDNIVQKLKGGIESIAMFAKAIKSANPQAATEFEGAIQKIMSGIKILTSGQAGPTSPQGTVPSPPQMAAESPAAATPEAT